MTLPITNPDTGEIHQAAVFVATLPASMSRSKENVQKSSVEDVHFFATFLSSGIC
jgi:hypothetical protein